MELTNSQKLILAATEQKIAVQACAAALKTSTLIEKTRQLLKNNTINPSDIAVITFTRLATQELLDRLGEDYRSGIFIGTIHSLAAHLLTQHGYGHEIDQIVEEEDFDKLFDLCQNINISQCFKYILVDEAQDCGEKELQFIFQLINPEYLFVCFDFNQSIYGFKGSRPDLLADYLDKYNFAFYHLNENFRNGSIILDYARAILKPTEGQDTSTPARKETGQVISMKYSPIHLINTIEQRGTYGSWAILCRTNRQVDTLIDLLDDYNIPNITFKQGDLTKKELEELMNSNKVKVLTIHSSKGLAWDNVVVFKPWWKNDEERRLNYVAVTRARNLLIMYK